MTEETKKAPVMRFQGFSDDWEQRKLGEVIDNQYNGQTPSRANASFWNGEINWLSSGELNRGVVSETIEKITEDGRKNANLKIVPKGTFVMAITGLEAAGTRGNCAKLGIDTTMNQSCMALFPKKKLLDSSFLFQWYRKVGEEYGLQYTQGTKQQSYNAELLKILPIVLPSVSEQVLIADFFDKIDDTIALHQRKLTLLKQLKQTYLQALFPQSELNIPTLRFARFSDSWEHRKVSSLAKETFGGGTPKTGVKKYWKGSFPWIQSSDLTTNQLHNVQPTKFITEEAIKQSATHNVPGNSIAIVTRVGVGKLALMRSSYSTSQDFLSLSNLNVDAVFGVYCLYKMLQREVNNIQGTSIKGITKADLLGKCVSVPTKVEEQVKIGAFFKKIDDTIDFHESKLKHILELKKAFLEKMFL